MLLRSPLDTALSCALAAITAASGAAKAESVRDVGELEEIVIGGSRILRQDYRSASPIITVSEELFEQTGTATVETVLNSLPQFVPSLTSTSNNPANAGQANIELRGLGTERTLVLLDGRRLVPANGTGVVDLNMLPESIIGSVEITSGGASAVYGSDAVAGVVNFKTRNFEGLEVETNWGQTGDGDGDAWQTSLTAGAPFAGGRGHAMVNVAYADRRAVLQGDRDFSRVALGYDRERGFVPTGSATIEEGRVTVAASRAAFESLFVDRYGVAPSGATLQNAFGFNADSSLFATGNGRPESVLNFRGERDASFDSATYTYNFAPPNYLQLPLERRSAYGRASYDLDESTQVFAQMIWASYGANTRLAPTPASGVSVPVTNPYLPPDLAFLAASRADPNAPLPFVKRMAEVGPRVAENDYDAYQLVTGISGALTPAWSYDAYGSFGRTRIEVTQFGNVSRGRFEELAYAADGGIAACGGFDPFRVGGITEACIDYITVDAVNRHDIRQTMFEATLAGNLLPLPAGELSLAAGFFYKEDRFEYAPDEALRQVLPDGRADIVGFNADADTFGRTATSDLYVEAMVPIARARPGIESLDVTLGYRYSDTTVGALDSYKGTLSYAPASVVRVRGSYQRAVRAPSIIELFQPQVTTYPFIEPGDPCNITSRARTGPRAAEVADLCLEHGLPAELLASYSNPNSQVEGRTGGNPELHEETADTTSFGVVLTSRARGIFADLQASIDYYSIEIDNAIDAVAARTFVSRCYDPDFNPELAADDFYCRLFERDRATGEIVNALELPSNIAAVRTAGVDVQLDWRFEAGPGQLSFNWLASYLDSYERQELPGDAFVEQKGTIGPGVATAFPEWKAVLNLGYHLEGIGLNARWRYVDGMVDRVYDGRSSDYPQFTVPSVSYFDLTASYAFEHGSARGLTLRGGVVNLTDEAPPIYPSWVQANTDPSTYEVLGRRYFVNLAYAF